MRRGLVGVIVVAAALAAGVPVVPTAAGGAAVALDSAAEPGCEITGISQSFRTDPISGSPRAAITEDGRALVYGTHRDIRRYDIEHGVETIVYEAAPQELVMSPVMSASGETIAFVAGAIGAGDGTEIVTDVVVHSQSSGQTSRISPQPGWNLEPTVSADGSTVAYNHGADVVVVNLGTGAATPIEADMTYKHQQPVSLSPDGSQVAFSSNADLTGQNPDRSAELFLHDVARASTRQLTSSPTTRHWYGGPRFVGDGQHLQTYANANFGGHNPSHTAQTFILDLNTRSMTAITLYPSVRMSGDRTLAAAGMTSDPVGTNGTRKQMLFSIDVRDGTVSQLTDPRSFGVSQPLAVDHDGNHIAFFTDSYRDGTRLDVATTCDPAPRADAHVATAAVRRYAGKDIYALFPRATQEATAPIAAAGSRSFLVRLQNDRTAVDSLTVARRDAGRPGYAVQYKHLGVDVTADPGVPAGARHRVEVTARSVANPVAGDTVRARVTAFRGTP